MKFKLDFTADNGHLMAYAYSDEGVYIDKGKSDVVIEYNIILPKQWASASAILNAVSYALGVALDVDTVDDAKSSWEIVRNIVTERLRISEQEKVDNSALADAASAAEIPPTVSATPTSIQTITNTKMGFWGRSSRRVNSFSGSFQRVADSNDEKQHSQKHL